MGQDCRISTGIFILVMGTYAFFFPGGGWNQNAQFDLSRAIVERQTLFVDGYDANTGDLSSGTGGHTYSNKAPGTSFLAVLPYAAAFAVERAVHSNIDGFQMMTFNAWLVTVTVCGASGALLASLLYKFARKRLHATPSDALALALLMAFGTYLFAYSTMLFSHVPSALFLLLAVHLMDEKPLLAGAAIGAASLCNYLCIPAALIVVIFIAARSWRRALRFVIGGIPFAILLGVYQNACFGAPWRTAVETSGTFTERNALFGVLVAPSAKVVYMILLSRYRGLFFTAPFLIFAIGGAIVMVRQRTMLRELSLAVSLFVMFVLANATFNGWHGGYAYGPRYLLTVVPLLVVPLQFSRALLRSLWTALCAISLAINFIVTAVDPLPPSPLPDPLLVYELPVFVTGRVPERIAGDHRWPDLRVGHVAVNPQAIDEKGPFEAHALSSPEAKWAAFNLGELILKRGSLWSLLPVVAWMILGEWRLRRLALLHFDNVREHSSI